MRTSAARIRERWRQWARRLKAETLTIYVALRDPRVPWYAKLLAAAVVAYALSPIDLVPDFVPVLGYLDDLVLVPLGIVLVARIIPEHVLDDCRARAQEMTEAERPRSWVAAAAIIAIWVLLLALAVGWVIRLVR